MIIDNWVKQLPLFIKHYDPWTFSIVMKPAFTGNPPQGDRPLSLGHGTKTSNDRVTLVCTSYDWEKRKSAGIERNL